LERVRREARALAHLDHPSLVPCHGLFEDLRLGWLGVSLDLVDGPSLAAAAQLPEWTPYHAVLALRHVAELLAYVHSEGIVHRDLKPDNVLLTQRFLAEPEAPHHVKVVDFGIAQVEGQHALTAVDHVVGTLAYLAPELLSPATFGGDAPRVLADVFAFGVMAYELFTRVHPTGLMRGSGAGDYALAYRRGLEQKSGWPAGVSGEWGALLRDCLAVEPLRRVPDGGVLAQRVRALSEVPVQLVGDVRGEALERFVHAATVQSPTFPPPPRPATVDTFLGTSGAELPPTRPLGNTAIAGVTPSSGRGVLDFPAGPELLALEASPRSLAELVKQPETVVVARRGPSLMTWGFAAVGASAIAVLVLFRAEISLLFGDAQPTVSSHAAPRPKTPGSRKAPVPAPEPSASATAAPSSLPEGCAPDAPLCSCCVMEQDCLGVCGEELSGELGLRVLNARGPSQTLLTEFAQLKVCVGLGGSRPGQDSRAGVVCARFAELDTATARGVLPVSSVALVAKGLDVRVFEPDNPVPVADSLDAPVPQLTRLAFCRGLEVKLADGDGRVTRVLLGLVERDAPPVAACRSAVP
jgi:serine/threonine-protein kinase